MKIIKVTNYKDLDPIYIEIDSIQHMYRDCDDYGQYTMVGTSGGGFFIKEDVDTLLKMLKTITRSELRVMSKEDIKF